MSKQVLILGAGYAGLTTAIRLARGGQARSGLSVRLIDRDDSFLDLIRLHKTIHTPLGKFRMELAGLAQRFGFEFQQAGVDLAGLDLAAVSAAGRLPTTAGELPFDLLAVCTGADGLRFLEADLPPEILGRRMLTLNTLRDRDGNAVIKEFLADTAGDQTEPTVTFVGGGATALQFLFEFKDFMQGARRKCRLRLVDLEERPLARFPVRFSEYAREKIEKSGIEYLPRTKFLTGDATGIECESAQGERLRFDSRLNFLFPGIQPTPDLACDPFGRVRVDHEVLPNVFAAGDCAVFAGGGLNVPTAQAAVRKGRRIAINMERTVAGEALEPYSYRELGYFVSLGFWDGVGFMLADGNVLTGVPAFAIKEAIEQQFALFAKGIDTYSIVENLPGLG